MEITLKRFRSEIITVLFKGPKPDDSKLQNSFFDSLIMNARAQAIDLYFKENNKLDPELFSSFTIDILKRTVANNISYYCEIPKIVDVGYEKGIRIKGTGDDPFLLNYWEFIPKERFQTMRSNLYASKRPKCARSGNTIYFMMKEEIKAAAVEAILYDPTMLSTFTENSLFPISTAIINITKEILEKTDLKRLKEGNSDNENDSVSPFSKSQPAQNPEQ